MSMQRASLTNPTDSGGLTFENAPSPPETDGEEVRLGRKPSITVKRAQYDRYGGPEEMYVGEHVLPHLKAHDVRVVVKAAAINPLDWKIREGTMKMLTGRSFPKGIGDAWCSIPGSVQYCHCREWPREYR